MKAVVLEGKYKIIVTDVPDPKIESPGDAIIRITTAGICGSDLHMYEGRSPIQSGTVLGHENMGIVEDVGPGVTSIKRGDRVVLPFNVSCGFCFNCSRGYTNACLTANPQGVGAGYGYTGLGPYRGGQAEYLRVPFADFNCLKLPGSAGDSLEDDFLLLSDIFPTAWHATELAQVKTGDSVAIFGAGPVGLLSAYSAVIRGASEIYVIDRSEERLKLVQQIGAIPVDFSKGDPVEQIIDLRRSNKSIINSRRPEEQKMAGVMCAIDAVGYQAQSQTNVKGENPMQIIKWISQIINPTGKVSLIGVFFPKDPGAQSDEAKQGEYTFPLGLFWDKGVSIGTGQTPVKQYNSYLRDLILSERAKPSFIVSHRMTLDKAPEAYRLFDLRGEGEGAGFTKVLLKPSLK